MNIPLIIFLVVVVVGISMAIIVGKRGVRWYNVHCANPDDSELGVYRTLGDRWWALDAGKFVTFRRRDGSKVRIGVHWIIKIESEQDATN